MHMHNNSNCRLCTTNKMGCVSSKPDINDLHPNIFQVMNVDEMGHLISPGRLEVTESELVLHQRGKQPIRWPLRCLRKYGFDSEIFSFECGRRCPTGAGIYAFRCRKAEQLFNMLQQNIQLRNLSDDTNPINNANVNNEFPLPIASTGPPVHRRVPSQPEGYLNPNPAPNNFRQHPCLSRPGSINSNGPISPPNMSPTPTTDIPSLEHNNNKRGSLIPDHSYTNTSAINEADNIPSPTYINLTTSPTLSTLNENYVNINENNSHLYMNVNTNEAKDVPNILPDLPNNVYTPVIDTDTEETKHCYANIDAKELEQIVPSTPNVPQTPTYVTIREVNYIELDLENSKVDQAATNSLESPHKTKKGYATIDFNKTNALSQSINPRMDVEEGSRKTRHNSTISDVPTHSSSLSD